MTTAVAIRNTEELALTQRQPVTLMRPIAAPAEVLKAQEETRQLIQEALQDGRDFGKIPGIDKPSLLKPGAERVALAFGCAIRFTIVEKEVDHDRVVTWVKKKKIFENRRFVRDEETTGTSLGLYRYVVECELVHRESGAVVGSCLGSCSSMESKYVDRPRDCENTIIKMAEKRAMVGATLTTFGLSEQFTQDVEDLPRDQVAGGAATEPGESNGGGAASEPAAHCPKCGGPTWDNRLNKTNPKAPDFKCRDRSCDGVIWPGQWPPADLATADQQATITDLLAKADLADKEKDKLRKRAASTTKPLTLARADEMIAYLQGLVPPAGMFDDENVGAAPAGSGGPVTMPAGGKVEDALDPPTGGAAPGASSARTAPSATSGDTAPPSTGSTSTASSDAPGLTKLSRDIGNLLKDKKLTQDERLQYRAKLDAATTLEQLQSLNAELTKYLDQPF